MNLILVSTISHLFHDAGFSFGESCVAPKLIVYVLHLNFDSAFGLLAIWRRSRGAGHGPWC